VGGGLGLKLLSGVLLFCLIPRGGIFGMGVNGGFGISDGSFLCGSVDGAKV